MDFMRSEENRPARESPPDLEHIWSQYREALLAFLRSKVANPDDVDDLLQEILLKTHKGLDGLSKTSSLKAWIFQIANNTIVDFYRARGREADMHPDDLWYSGNDEAERHMFEGCVAPFMDALPPDVARLLRRIDLQGMSQKDCAADLGISYSTLKSRVQAGRLQLRQLFERCCELSFDANGAIVDYRRRADTCGHC